MKQKIAILNFVLMLSVILAVSYQSLHTVFHHTTHEKNSEISNSNDEHEKVSSSLEKEHCDVCDFKFASFLSPKNFTYSFFFPFKESPYSFSVKEALSFFTGSLYSLRGPPFLI
ncbi:hypothetical protein FIA58_017090 [Flavobacterium jejuense]|uniref:DUF2946 domain-containing protein n=1 Tax=Flavobacterium jejuense TaxID=1544455 RepID=A0ABX0IUL2_9FLAO|nr:hypothetical protein [Flavobacterium jejuense]NHN27398.1 hypothetical protein [Flavobacterium jejuense]